jgi:predicted N-acetyltransferase YhbS
MDLPGIPQRLHEDLVIRACRTEADAERVAALNGEIHGSTEGEAVRRWLLKGHPQIRPEGWLFVEDEETGEAVATLSLMPLTWRCGPVSLPVAELGFVATRPAYRKQGLQRALSAAFDRIALANGYTLAAIEGIPFFYRQFGYEYALPLYDSLFNWPLNQIPRGRSAGFSFRPAALADVAALADLYREQTASLDITTERSDEMWHYLVQAPEQTLFRMQIYVQERRDGQMVGYLGLGPSGWANRLTVFELSADRQDAILAALRFAGERARAGGHEAVGLQLPANHPACVLAHYRGIKKERPYGWQMKVLDPVGFLEVIAPVLEKRLASSLLSGTREELIWNLYQDRVGLRIEDGRVAPFAPKPAAEADVGIPPLVATQLWLGWKSFAALDDWHKDVWAKDEKRLLLEVLFPPTRAHIYVGY